MLKSSFNKKSAVLPVDEFGVKHHNMFYNEEDDRFFCLLDASKKEAIEKYHDNHGLKCEWITEVKLTAWVIISLLYFYKLLGTYISNNN